MKKALYFWTLLLLFAFAAACSLGSCRAARALPRPEALEQEHPTTTPATGLLYPKADSVDKSPQPAAGLSAQAAADLSPRQARQYRRTLKAQSQARARELEAQAHLEAASRFPPAPAKVKNSSYAAGAGASASQNAKKATGAAGAEATATSLDKTSGQAAVGDSLALTSTAKNGVTGNGNVSLTKQAASWKVWALWIGVIGGALGVWYLAAPLLAWLPSRQRLLGWAGYGKRKSNEPVA